MAVTDKFEKYYVNPTDPATIGYELTPNDSANTEFFTRAIYVGVGGDVAVDLVGNVKDPAFTNKVVFKNVATGSILSVRISKLYATDTTATNIIGLI